MNRSLTLVTGTSFQNLYTSGIDPVVTGFSHELSETMTDPDPGSGWFGSGGGSDENGDKCAYQYVVGSQFYDLTGLPRTGTGAFYNTTLNGRHYLLQTEYDNRAGGCNQWDTDPQPSASVSGPGQVAKGSPATFSLGNVNAPAGVAYVTWYFGDGATTTATGGGSVQHTYSSAATRTVTAIVTDNDGNEVRETKVLTVTSGGGNSVAAHPPSNARVKTAYSIKLSGHAIGTKTLYLFVDYKTCASTPAGEHARASGDIWTVQGNFSETSKGWKSPSAGPDHACAYLVKRPEPKNPNTGVVAHAFATYTIHH